MDLKILFSLGRFLYIAPFFSLISISWVGLQRFYVVLVFS